MSDKPTIAIIGGTGALGTGLARRWALAGYPVVIGSRSAESAAKAAEALKDLLREKGVQGAVSGAENVEAAKVAEIVVLTVPFSQHAGALAALRDAVQGKLVLDTTAPLVPPPSEPAASRFRQRRRIDAGDPGRGRECGVRIPEVAADSFRRSSRWKATFWYAATNGKLRSSDRTRSGDGMARLVCRPLPIRAASEALTSVSSPSPASSSVRPALSWWSSNDMDIIVPANRVRRSKKPSAGCCRRPTARGLRSFWPSRAPAACAHALYSPCDRGVVRAIPCWRRVGIRLRYLAGRSSEPRIECCDRKSRPAGGVQRCSGCRGCLLRSTAFFGRRIRKDLPASSRRGCPTGHARARSIRHRNKRASLPSWRFVAAALWS